MDPEEFRRHGHALIDWLADYRSSLETRPVRAELEPGSLRARCPAAPPTDPEDFAAVLGDLERIVLPGLTLWQHPRFCGFFPSNSELSAVLGDLASTGLGVLGLSWQASPALTEIEELVVDWLRQMLGLEAHWSGVITDTASSATLVALLCARERSSGFALDRGGLQAQERPLVVYVSAHSHSSVEKAALLAGFGRANVRSLPVDAHFAMRVDALERALAEDRAAGRLPTAIVATTGTTSTTALDPLEPIAALAAREKVWLHVDAAMAGSAMICPELRWMWRGVEGADSLVFNPHKWLGASFDCSLYYVRDPEHLVRVMSTSPSYLQSAVDGRVKNLRDWGLPLGRRFRALKLWFLLREQGVSGLQARIRRDLDHARWLAGEIDAAPDWQRLAPVPLQTVCARHTPPGLAADALERHTLRWVESLNRSGIAYLTPAQLDGRWMARVSLGALGTERRHVEEVWQAMRAAARDSAAASAT